MKTREIAFIVVILAFLVISCHLAFGVNEEQQPKPLIDYLVQPESSVFNAYGWSEETVKLYNLIDLRAICNNQEARIKALELQVAELIKAQNDILRDLFEIVDPNEVAK